jgi:alkyl hydroperoxide reductase subunit AhpC
MFGVYDEATGLALRGTFIINPEGTLLNSEVNFYNLGRGATFILQSMEMRGARPSGKRKETRPSNQGRKWWARSMRPSNN